MASTVDFKTLLEGVGQCIPVMDPINTTQSINLNQIHFPCNTHLDMMLDQYCGIFMYVDPMDKCMDSNPINDVQIIPVHISDTSCENDWHEDFEDEDEEYGVSEDYQGSQKKGGKNGKRGKGGQREKQGKDEEYDNDEKGDHDAQRSGK